MAGQDQPADKCPHCGAPVIKGAYKCGKCGKPLATLKPPSVDSKAGFGKCPHCGKDVIKGAYKCPGCGKVLAAASTPAAAAKPKSNCPHCGKEIIKGSSKCNHCGKTIAAAHYAQAAKAPEPETQAKQADGQAAETTKVDDKHCPKCGKEAPEGKFFCGYCGTKLNRKPAAAAKAPGPEEPEPPPAEVVYLAYASLGLGFTAMLIALVTRKPLFGALPALLAVAAGVYALVKNKIHGPALNKIIASSGIATAALGLISPAVSLVAFLLGVGIAIFFRLHFFLQRQFGKRTGWSIVIISAFAFMILSGFIMQSVFELFLEKPSVTEANYNLIGFRTAQQHYFAYARKFAESFEELTWKPAKQKNYAFFLSPTDSIQPPDKIIKLPEAQNIRPMVYEEGYRMCAVGNLDQDPKLDVWCIEPNFIPEHIINDMEP